MAVFSGSTKPKPSQPSAAPKSGGGGCGCGGSPKTDNKPQVIVASRPKK